MVARPFPDAVTIAFWSEASAVGSLEWGPTASYGSAVADPSPRTKHALVASGLSPATTYHYRILLGGTAAGLDHAFSTPPSSTTAPVRFVVLGDTGTGCAQEYAAIAKAAEQAPDFVLDTGDVAYDSGTANQVQSRFVVPFADLAATTPVFPVIGNHDADSAGGQPLLDAVVLPANAADPAGHYYSFDWGACHVIALDSNRSTAVGSAQDSWLASDLAAASAPWTFAFFHHPVYSSSSHGSTPALQRDLVPRFDAAGLDVAFSGHDHDYERTFPMRAGAPVDVAMEPDYVGPGATVYVVTGGGGKDLYAAGTSAFTAFSVSTFHVTLVEVAGPTLTLTAIGTEGTVLDRATITK